MVLIVIITVYEICLWLKNTIMAFFNFFKKLKLDVDIVKNSAFPVLGMYDILCVLI